MRQGESERRLFTRLDTDKFAALPSSVQEILHYDCKSETAVQGEILALDKPVGITIVSAGSSDAPVVAETRATLAYYRGFVRLSPTSVSLVSGD